MEAILHACGVENQTPFDAFVEMKVVSLRTLRDIVLDELILQRDGNYEMSALRRVIERLASSHAPSQVVEYWEERLQSIPDAEQSPNITPIELGDALRHWLEVLLEDYLDVYSEGSSDSQTGEYSPHGQVPAFGFNTADFGGGALAGTAEFGNRQSSSGPASVADRFSASIDISGGGTFGSARMQQLTRLPPVRSPGIDCASVPSWLRDSEQGESREVRLFRENLARQIALHSDGSEALTVSQLYSAVRDVVETQQEASGPVQSSTPRRRAARSAICAGVRRLAGVKNRWLRRVFRDLESQTLLDPLTRPLIATAHSEGSDIIAELVVSQARAAEVLERRADCFPVAYRLAWVMDIVRRRYLGCFLTRLQLLGDPGGAAATSSKPASPRPSPAASPGIQSPGFDFHSEDRGAASSHPSSAATTAHRGRVSVAAAARNLNARTTEARSSRTTTGLAGVRRSIPSPALDPGG